MAYESLTDFAADWQDTPEHARKVAEAFDANVNADKKLKSLRDYVETRGYGFGERCFYWMWKLIVSDLPPKPNLLEIGVYKGQILTLWRVLSKTASITGVTPLDASGGMAERDYAQDIANLHDVHALPKNYSIIQGRSDEDSAIKAAAFSAPYDVVYIDGGHSYAEAYHDIQTFAPMLKVGGFLVIDDCSNRFRMPNGYFQGIEDVSRAVDALLPPFAVNGYFKHIGAVVHNRIWKRIA